MAERSIADEIKERIRIEDIIAEDQPLSAHGRYRRGGNSENNSLVVDVRKQYFVWNSRDLRGDVFSWLKSARGMDFKAAAEYLASRCGLPKPEWQKEQHASYQAQRVIQEALDVAVSVFAKWLHEDADAMEYCRSRGWTDETIEGCRLGYSRDFGKGDENRQEMIKAFRHAGVDPLSPAAVAVVGYTGDVASWGKKHNVDVEDWVEKGRIPSMIGFKRLVYPHIVRGQVVYLSGRSIHEKRHYNLPDALMGGRRLFYNQEYTSDAEACVVVEGQADAISLGQWGIAAVALAGLKPKEEDNLAEAIGIDTLYVGLDAEGKAQSIALQVAGMLGPMTRLMDWHNDPHYHSFVMRDENGEATREVKDANDLLRAYAQAELPSAEQGERLAGLLAQCPTYVEIVCDDAGKTIGAKRDLAIREAIKVVARMDELDRASYRSRLSRALGVSIRDFNNLVKAVSATIDNADGEPVFTLGGYIDGYLIEYLYDPMQHRSSLAWRDPDGNVHSGDNLVIKGTRYMPIPPTQTFKDGGVLFPSGLGPLKTTREIVSQIEFFIRSVYLFGNKIHSRIMAYYALLTWVYDCFNTVPYLRAVGEAGGGKSELMARVGHVCYRLMRANGAGTAASLFRSVERYRGTVLIDEADLRDSDTTNDIVKFLNLGAMRNNPIWRLEEVIGADGRKEFVEKTYQTFCPKLLAMRRDFRDDAVGSRSITFKIQPRETSELVAANVPLAINAEVRARSLALRNMLLRWRMQYWQEEIEVRQELYDTEVSSRLNQVTGPLLALSADDQDLQREMRQFLRDYYADMVLSKSMTITARVIEALWKIYQYPDLRLKMIKTEPDGTEKILVGSVARIANEIIDEMNSDEDSDGGGEQQQQKKNKRDELSPHRVGRIIREDLQLFVEERKKDGYYLHWDSIRMEAVAKRWGVRVAEVGPDQEKRKTAPASEQKSLLG